MTCEGRTVSWKIVCWAVRMVMAAWAGSPVFITGSSLYVDGGLNQV